MLERLARTMYRRRRSVLVIWIVAAHRRLRARRRHRRRVQDRVQASRHREPGGLRPARALELPRPADPGPDRVPGRAGHRRPAGTGGDREPLATIDEDVDDVTVVSPYSPEGQRQVGRDDIAYAELNFADRSAEDLLDAGEEVKAEGDEIDVEGLTIEYGGDMFATDPISGASEAIGVLAAMVILLIAFGSVLAMGLPIGTALFGIGTGIALVLIVRTLIDMPDFTTAAVAMIGIGVGIDYALFIVTRYREHLDAGLDPERSVVPRDRHRRPRRALRGHDRGDLGARSAAHADVDHAGRRRSRSRSACSPRCSRRSRCCRRCSASSDATSTSSVAAVGKRRAQREHTQTVWYRWSRVIQRRPWPAAIVGFLVLLLLAVPIFSMRFGFGDAGNRPTSDTTRAAPTTSSPKASARGSTASLLLVAETPDGDADVAVMNALSAAVNEDPGVAFATPAITPANEEGDVALVQVFPTTDPAGRGHRRPREPAARRRGARDRRRPARREGRRARPRRSTTSPSTPRRACPSSWARC